MIQYGKHSIDLDDIKEVEKVLKSDWLTTGPYVDMFEGAIENLVGTPAVVVSSGTAALHCAYAAIDIKEGDEVITSPITFIATQATAALLGAKIRFVDVQSDTANIDPRKVENAINRKTKAIVAVDFAGHPADLNELREIAKKHNLYLIEDAAHSIGSKYRNQFVGTLADITTFSFFPTKNMTSGEGGAIVSKDPKLLDKARKFARQGLIREREKFQLQSEGDWHQEVHSFGLNYRLPDILCALGLSQIKKIDKFKARRQEIFDKYVALLSGIEGIELPTKRQYVDVMWHLFPIRVNANRRADIFQKLRQFGIGVQVNYLPAHRHPVFKNLINEKLDLEESNRFYSEELSLPIHYELKNHQIEYIVSKIEEVI